VKNAFTNAALAALTVGLVAGSAPQAAAADPTSPAPAAGVGVAPKHATPTPAERAKSLLAQLQAGKLDRTALTPGLSALLTDETVASDASVLGPYGAPSAVDLLRQADVDGVSTYDFRVTWSAGAILMTVGIDDATQKVARLIFHRATS
jgi:hypothetical protein